MSSPKHQMSLFVHVFLFSMSILIGLENAQAQNQSLETSNSIQRSLYSFGDSYVDPGNNDYIQTDVRSNFLPYGIDFPDGIATGRFSNGLLFPDLLAKSLHCSPFQLPYLGPAPNYDEPTAISFASAGSGYDVDTADKNKAIRMWKQLDYFKKYKAALKDNIGNWKANMQIKEAVYFVSAGSDDFTFNFFCNAANLQTANALQDYLNKLMGLIPPFIKELSVRGARRIAVTGLPPLGCIPIDITKLSQTQKDLQTATTPKGKRKCVADVNRRTENFNDLLREKLQKTESQLPGTKIAYIDFYEPLLRMIQNPNLYGFDELNKGCCGTGLTEIGPSCNEACLVCDDTSKYVFWDAAHPTQTAFEILFTNDDNVDAMAKITGD